MERPSILCSTSPMLLISALAAAAVPLHSALEQLTLPELKSLLLQVHQGALEPAAIPDVLLEPGGRQSGRDGALGRALAEQPLKAVPLFHKPASSTGALVVAKAGLDVIRAQKEPFSIISAVGPTRTGKSSILGRAFLRGDRENLFEVGSGVTSFTGGVWITSEPLLLQGGPGQEALRVFLIDTEGFSGVGGLTSRTYEANLFGVVYLLSSALIFNSMFPVDASTVSQLNRHCARSLQMLKALGDAHFPRQRKAPSLIWSVQSFNMHQLRNTGLGAADLLAQLQRSSEKRQSDPAVSALLGSTGSASHAAWLVDQLFESTTMVPVRRPHANDEIVANLAKYKSSKLSPKYLHDADTLRATALRGLLPAHDCGKEAGPEERPCRGRGRKACSRTARPPLFPPDCKVRPLVGSQLVLLLERWIRCVNPALTLVQHALCHSL